MSHSYFGVPSESIELSSYDKKFTAKIGITDSEIFQIHVSPAFEMSLPALTEILYSGTDSQMVDQELIKTPSAALMVFRIERDGCLGEHTLASCSSVERVTESLQSLVDTLSSIECSPW